MNVSVPKEDRDTFPEVEVVNKSDVEKLVALRNGLNNTFLINSNFVTFLLFKI